MEETFPDKGILEKLTKEGKSLAANKVHFSSVLEGQKDCGMIVRTPLALVIGLKPDASPSV